MASVAPFHFHPVSTADALLKLSNEPIWFGNRIFISKVTVPDAFG